MGTGLFLAKHCNIEASETFLTAPLPMSPGHVGTSDVKAEDSHEIHRKILKINE